MEGEKADIDKVFNDVMTSMYQLIPYAPNMELLLVLWMVQDINNHGKIKELFHAMMDAFPEYYKTLNVKKSVKERLKSIINHIIDNQDSKLN